MAEFFQANLFLTLATLIFFLVGIVITIQQLFFEEDPVESRLTSLRKNLDKKEGKKEEDLWSSIVDFAMRINPVAVLGRREAEKARAPLVTAGYRSQDALTVFVLFKLLLSAVFGGGALLIFIITGRELGTLAYIAIFSAAVFGSIVSTMILEKIAKARQARLRKVLPDIVDILLICIRAGMTFETAVQRVLMEKHEYLKEMNDELQVTLTEMQILQERSAALQRFAKRLDFDEAKILASSVIQAERYGTSLSETFEVMSEEMREKRVADAEAWAARAPVLLTIPMVFFLLPLLFIVVLGPGVIQIIYTFR